MLTRWLVLIVILISALRQSAHAQLTDPLPDIHLGDAYVQLSVFTAGLPVEKEFVTPVFSQRVGPTDLATIPGSNALVVTTYGGKAFVLDSNGNQQPTPFLDLATASSPTWNPDFEVGGAHGLTSLAFHTDFAQPGAAGFGKFYTLEAEAKDSGPADFSESVVPGNHHQDVLYEYTLSSPLATVCAVDCAATKREVLRLTQPGWHHNLGDLLFDEQGLLYIASGDGSVGGTQPPIMSDNSTILSNVFGKVLRIDPLGTNSANGKYGIPAANPFVDGPGGNVDEIFAYGLRNPFRLEFDALTGQLYASETGEESIESIEAIVAGGNHGWNIKEGSFLYDRTTRSISVDIDQNGNGQGDVAEALGLIDPFLEYDRGSGRAVVGAVPYRGNLIASLENQLVFADFSGALFHVDLTTREAFRMNLDATGAQPPYNIHSVNRNAEGEIFVLGIARLNDTDFDGVVLKMFASPALAGDLDGDGMLTAADIDLLAVAIRAGSQETFFDLSVDGQVDEVDYSTWVVALRRTYLGDANLDDVFDSNDLIEVAAANEYEDGVFFNSGWSTGDWDGDGDFTSDDLIAAAADDGYDQGPRTVSVPEPSSWCLCLLAWVACFFSATKRNDGEGWLGMSDAKPQKSNGTRE